MGGGDGSMVVVLMLNSFTAKINELMSQLSFVHVLFSNITNAFRYTLILNFHHLFISKGRGKGGESERASKEHKNGIEMK